MSINGEKEHNNILNRRRYNSLERKKFEYFFPNHQTGNRTIDYGDNEYFKPRIRKNKKLDIHNYNNDISYMSRNNDLNRKNINHSVGVYSTYNNNFLKDNEQNNNNNNIPRIVRNKKNVTKYVNKDNNLREKQRFNYNIKNNSMDKNYYMNKGNKIYNNNNNNEYNKSNNNIRYTNNNYTINNINDQHDYQTIKENKIKKINRNSSFDNKIKISDNITNLLCRNCFDRKMLEDQNNNTTEIDKIEYLNDKFINENPFYFIDKMSDNEKKRINDKIESNSNKQRLALANYKKEIDNPKNNTKEKLQLINEYSLNPLSIDKGKDPRYVKLKNNFDKKEKIIQNNPNIYKSMEPRKAYNDYYNKCIYQVPKIENRYYINPVYKENYIKTLKKQIEDKKNKEYENRRKQREAEALANKQFNEYKKMANLHQKENHNKGIKKLINDNKQLDDFKAYTKNVLREKERKLGNELVQKNDNLNKSIQLRNRNEKNDNLEIYQVWLNDVNIKNQAKKDNKDEEDRKWNNYIYNYNIKCNHSAYANCDICNRPYEREKLKKYPPPSSTIIDYNVN